MHFEKSPSIIQRTKTQSACFPCFFGSSVADSDDPEQAKKLPPPAAQAGSKRKLSAWFSYSGLPKKENKKKKQQHVDVSSAALGKKITAGPDRSKETPAAKKCLDDEKPFLRQNRTGTALALGEIRKCDVTRPKTAEPTAPGDPNPIAKSSDGSADRIGSTRRNRSVSLDHGSARTGRLVPPPALCVLAATLAVLVFFGRASAVICLCSCFYVLQLTKAMAVAAAETRRVSREAHVDSSEYKKRVVVEGLLERSSRRYDGRRTSPHLLPFPTAS